MKASFPFLVSCVVYSVGPLAAEAEWQTDYEAARQLAARENKDLLLDFTGTDWCSWCIRLKKEVFSQPGFAAYADEHFVLVQIDLPKKRQLDPELLEQNRRLVEEMAVNGFPTVALCDAKGRLYAKTGYRPGGVEPYLGHLEELRKIRQRRDEAFGRASQLQGVARAGELMKGLAVMDPAFADLSYPQVVAEILRLDPPDALGLAKSRREAEEREKATRRRAELLQAFFTGTIRPLIEGDEFEKLDPALADFLAEHPELPEANRQVLIFNVGLARYRADLDHAAMAAVIDRLAREFPESDYAREGEAMKKRLRSHVEKSHDGDRGDASAVPRKEDDAVADGPIVQTARLTGEESDAELLGLAARIVPSPRQLEYHREEYIGFIHFGPNTFSGVEWGNGKEDPTIFNPPSVDTDQWCRVMKEAGMSKVILTVKHHDGYCTWQTRYNDRFSVHRSPWKNGKGDVLRLLAESCRRHGLKLGVYLSPADLFQIESVDGLYGNGSEPVDSVIPTDPATFRSDPTRGRTPPDGRPVFRHELDDYNRYFMNQLYELLTEYGPVHEVWFDGAHPKRKGGQAYRKDLWFEMIRDLAPEAVIFGGPDVRWCGNEHGGTRTSEWNVLPIESLELSGLDRPAADIGTDEALLARGYEVYGRKLKANFLNYMVCEVDTSIRHGWFWRDANQHVRSAAEVYDIYECSAGGNSVFLLNIPPNRDGRFSDRDVEVLLSAGRRIKRSYGRTAASLSSEEGGIHRFDEVATINRVMLMEPIATEGQRVKAHAVDAWVDGAWQEIAKATTIGYKRILRFPDVSTDRIRVRIMDQRAPARISRVSVHHDVPPLRAPEIFRDREGRVNIGIPAGASVRYTLNGEEPDGSSLVFEGVLDLAKGGTVKAVAVRGEERSEVATARFDIAKTKWKILAASSENPGSGEGADKAIDGDPNTLWHSKWSGGTDPHPHQIAIDLGELLDLSGFTYLPRSDNLGGVLDCYRLELSRDGEKWVTADEGRFDNIRNDPSLRRIRFEKVHPAVRYLRLTGLHSVEEKSHSSAAEIGVITR